MYIANAFLASKNMEKESPWDINSRNLDKIREKWALGDKVVRFWSFLRQTKQEQDDKV